LTAAIAAGVLLAGLSGSTGEASAWAMAGFGAMAFPIIVTGAWLAHEQGRAGVAFVIALSVGLLLRAGLLAIVVAAAARQGEPSLLPALSGLVLGFVPLTAFEMTWFARRARIVVAPVGSRR
jgi:hypothetical protein